MDRNWGYCGCELISAQAQHLQRQVTRKLRTPRAEHAGRAPVPLHVLYVSFFPHTLLCWTPQRITANQLSPPRSNGIVSKICIPPCNRGLLQRLNTSKIYQKIVCSYIYIYIYMFFTKVWVADVGVLLVMSKTRKSYKDRKVFRSSLTFVAEQSLLPGWWPTANACKLKSEIMPKGIIRWISLKLSKMHHFRMWCALVKFLYVNGHSALAKTPAESCAIKFPPRVE